MKVSSGNRGDAVRSDCYVELSDELGTSNQIFLKSKVGSLYGKSIKELCLGILDFFELSGITVNIDDSGALPFVIAARMEAAITNLVQTDKQYLFEILDQNRYKTKADRFRRSRLYLPGNNPKLMINAGIYGSDAVILDLEDSVAPGKKYEARLLVRNALCAVDFYGSERMVRINQLPAGLEDLKYIVPFNVNTILIPKCEQATSLREVENEIVKLAGTSDHGIHLMPIIESALGIENAFQIATASPHVVALAIGLEDYTADLGVQRTYQGNESWYARTRIVNAACAVGIQAIDSVFSEFEDLTALDENVQRSKNLGFVGMGCIHPRQVKVINEGFAPGDHEIDKAKKIVIAFYKASEEGEAVIAVGSKMVDPPVVKRALNTINHAILCGKLETNWRENYEG